MGDTISKETAFSPFDSSLAALNLGTVGLMLFQANIHYNNVSWRGKIQPNQQSARFILRLMIPSHHLHCRLNLNRCLTLRHLLKPYQHQHPHRLHHPPPNLQYDRHQ